MSTPLDYESLARLQNDTTPTLCLTIRGTDVPGGGKPALSSSCEVAIEESDVNEPPQMPSKDDGHAQAADRFLEIGEDKGVGTEVGVEGVVVSADGIA